jgi:hypothetical protein
MMSASAREADIERLSAGHPPFTRKPLAIVLADADGNFHRQTERRLQHGHAVQYTVWLLEADSRSTP